MGGFSLAHIEGGIPPAHIGGRKFCTTVSAKYYIGWWIFPSLPREPVCALVSPPPEDFIEQFIDILVRLGESTTVSLNPTGRNASVKSYIVSLLPI